MGKKLESLTPGLEKFIEKQPIFFVGTAMREGRVNVSPKGMDSLRVLGPNQVVWLNLTGSGNETATHLLESDRMTIMFCAFEGAPMILRLYGKAKVFHPRDEAFHTYSSLFPSYAGARQIILLDFDLVQTSCGYAVPFMDFVGERDELVTWSEKKGEEGMRDYWKEKNTVSIDGHETKIFE